MEPWEHRGRSWDCHDLEGSWRSWDCHALGGILEELGFPCPGGVGIAVSSPSTPPAARGHPAPSHQLFQQAAPLQMGTSGSFLGGGCSAGAWCPLPLGCPHSLSPHPHLSPLPVPLLSATVKQLDHLPARIDFCFPISKLDGRKRLKTVCQFEVE